ncbi:pyridoxal 5-phosphate synthase [Sesbania bispinosa]|nr:pyridoxal 5-phosphate synthase [Sesbania bispinosa]
MLTSKKSSPSSGVVQGELHQRELHQPDISFLSPMEWVGDGEGGDSPERGIARFEARRLGRMENEQHARDMVENVGRGRGVATINGHGYSAVGEGRRANNHGSQPLKRGGHMGVIAWSCRDQHLKGREVFAVTKGHNGNGGAPSHGRENGGAGCALRLEHHKTVRLLGRRDSGATERRSENNWKRTSREGWRW